ncbi:hypothetical protein BH160DRAFT_1722 [Burkholderia sp. H160]|nr:hypothetical protein BH160DRAFT_1722 [Burkholderia sp. H160]
MPARPFNNDDRDQPERPCADDAGSGVPRKA